MPLAQSISLDKMTEDFTKINGLFHQKEPGLKPSILLPIKAGGLMDYIEAIPRLSAS